MVNPQQTFALKSHGRSGPQVKDGGSGKGSWLRCQVQQEAELSTAVRVPDPPPRPGPVTNLLCDPGQVALSVCILVLKIGDDPT